MTRSSLAEWTNSRLVAECLEGNQRAWAALIERYRKLIYSIPLRFGAPVQDAADIFQSVCLELFNELPRLRDAEALQGWLVRVATHRCYEWKRSQTNSVSDSEETERIAAGADLVTAVIEEVEREQMVREAIGQLPPRCRRMVELLFFEQPPLPYREVAKRLGLAAGSVGFIRGRCLTKLKAILEEKGF